MTRLKYPLLDLYQRCTEVRPRSVSYYAPIAFDMVLLPRTNYALKGQIAVDKVVVWIEKEDDAEPVIAPIAVRRYQQRPSAPLFIPIVVPK